MISVLDSRSRSTAMFDASTVLRIHTFLYLKKCVLREVSQKVWDVKRRNCTACV